MFRKIILTVTALAFTVFYFYHDPSARAFGPPCLIHQTTGWYCWGCGGQRAFHALLKGDFSMAFQNNLLIFLVLPIMGIMLASELLDRPKLLFILRNRYFVVGLVIFVIGFTILRNMKGFEAFIPNLPNKP
jgi:Protein of unknown function (DUF2752)